MKSRGAFSWLAAFALLALSGCTVISVTTSAVGLAADAAIGTVKIVGKGVGMAADAAFGSDEKPDNSGITIRYREPTDADRALVAPSETQATKKPPSP